MLWIKQLFTEHSPGVKGTALGSENMTVDSIDNQSTFKDLKLQEVGISQTREVMCVRLL